MKRISGVLIGLVALAAIAVLVFTSMVCMVDPGFSGVQVRLGAVSDKVLDSGFHFKDPFTKVVQMSNKEQMRQQDMVSFSRDVQEVALQLNVNFRLNRPASAQMYKDVGTDYVSIVMAPRVLEITKNVIAEYTAEMIVAQREIISRSIRDQLSAEMEQYGITVQQVSVADVDFNDAYTNAVEAKQVATQNKLQAAIEQERALAEAANQQAREKLAADTQAYRVRQEADANAYSIQSEAEATAEANRKIAESLTPELIEYQQILQWNGMLPQVQLGNGAAGGSTGAVSPIIDLR